MEPNIGLAEGLASVYFAVSILGFLAFSFIMRRGARDYGEKVPFMLRGMPMVNEHAYDQAMKKRGRRSHARIWGAILLLNAVLAFVAFRTIVVPALEKSAQQSGRHR